MTQDFIEDFTDALEKEGRPYCVIVGAPSDGKGETTHAKVYCNDDHWHISSKSKQEPYEDWIDIIKSCFERD